ARAARPVHHVWSGICTPSIRFWDKFPPPRPRAPLIAEAGFLRTTFLHTTGQEAPVLLPPVPVIPRTHQRIHRTPREAVAVALGRAAVGEHLAPAAVTDRR